MTRKQTNEIAKELLSKQEDIIKGDHSLVIWKKYQEMYDMETHRPSTEYVDFYNEMKKEIGKMGIKFRYNFLF